MLFCKELKITAEHRLRQHRMHLSVNMVLNVGGGGGGEITYLSLHCHHQNDSCIKMGSDESHFNVSVGSDEQSHKTVSNKPQPF